MKKERKLYTTREFARMIGRSPDTIARWRREGYVTPSSYKQMGQVRVHLYTETDLVRGHRFAAEIKPGRSKAAK